MVAISLQKPLFLYSQIAVRKALVDPRCEGLSYWG